MRKTWSLGSWRYWNTESYRYEPEILKKGQIILKLSFHTFKISNMYFKLLSVHLTLSQKVKILLIPERILPVHTVISRNNYTTCNHWCFTTLISWTLLLLKDRTWIHATVQGQRGLRLWKVLKLAELGSIKMLLMRGEGKQKLNNFWVFSFFFFFNFWVFDWVLLIASIVEKEGPVLSTTFGWNLPLWTFKAAGWWTRK